VEDPIKVVPRRNGEMSGNLDYTHWVARAVWNGTVLAESDRFEVVEGSVCHLPDSPRRELFRQSWARRIAGILPSRKGVQVER
jgi:uncharacterized protein (DUF427 family)